MAAPTNYTPADYSQPPQLTISGGRILNNNGHGVGCDWFSKCTISASTISGNAQDGVWDVTYNGAVSITDSRITLNGGRGVYGGHSRMPGPKIANSEISLNGLGGVRVNGGINLKNSTISGNGEIGLYVNYTPSGCRSAQIDNVTVTGNHGGGARFLCNFGSPRLLLNTIIAGNVGNDCSNYGTSYGTDGPIMQGSLIGDGSCDAAALGALTGDAKLAPLLDNGGLTLTHGLRFGLSPAINAGLEANCQTTDQRGIARPQDSACDIGALEIITTAHPSVAAADAYLTASVQAKGVSGTGTGTMPGFRVRAVRQQLRVAGDLVDQGKTADACAQLTRTLTRIDTDGASPDDDDYLTGPSSPDLVKQVRTSQGNLGCT